MRWTVTTANVRAAAAALAATLLTASPVAAAPSAVGQKVEVREGDTWSAAAVVKQEGRKYQVHYAGADAAGGPTRPSPSRGTTTA